MAGLVPAIHALAYGKKGVDARDKRGHDAATTRRHFLPSRTCRK